MVQEYKLKTNPITLARLHKLAKQLIDESKEDRDKALATYDYFKALSDGSEDGEGRPQDTAQKCMIDCLKLAQESRNKTLKAVELILKAAKELGSLENPEESGKDFSFDELDI